jgi:O-antigen ligase
LVFYFEVFSKYNIRRVVGISTLLILLLGGVFFVFIQKNPFMKEKYGSIAFSYMDKVGKLDEIENPEGKLSSAFVTRLSIWKSAWELSLEHPLIGVGASDGKDKLIGYFKQTNQRYLARNKYPTHNQFLDFFLKFGILGPVVVSIYISLPGYLGFSLKNALILFFFFLFFSSNLTDDFLLRFDGIAFSGLWVSIFSSYWLQQIINVNKEHPIT